MVNRNNLIHGRSIDHHPLSDRAGVGRYAKHGTVLAAEAPQGGIIDTPEGQMTFQPGDFILTDDPPTHAWPVRRDVFEQTYTKIADLEEGQIPTGHATADPPRVPVSAPAGNIVEKKLTGQAPKGGKRAPRGLRRGIADSKTLAMDDGER